jgi:membrane peptidoglycan carboxypeptidase
MTGDMPLAVTTMEDPGFEHHRGFIVQAFSNSFLDNLKQGRFLRGGSTITMQLAKNLWLTREKTLGRKVQEFFLSQALESCYSKDEIMELYLNVVEFGPNQYGVGNGSMHWFHKGPGELVPTEAFWLASILPRPSRTQPPTDSSLKHVEGLMKRLAEDGRIPNFTDDMVEPEEVQTPEEP